MIDLAVDIEKVCNGNYKAKGHDEDPSAAVAAATVKIDSLKAAHADVDSTSLASFMPFGPTLKFSVRRHSTEVVGPDQLIRRFL